MTTYVLEIQTNHAYAAESIHPARTLLLEALGTLGTTVAEAPILSLLLMSEIATLNLSAVIDIRGMSLGIEQNL